MATFATTTAAAAAKSSYISSLSIRYKPVSLRDSPRWRSLVPSSVQGVQSTGKPVLGLEGIFAGEPGERPFEGHPGKTQIVLLHGDGRLRSGGSGGLLMFQSIT